jgi:hypothetical protein
MRSPCQCPGTARSLASAGRWLISTSGVTNFLPRLCVRARGTRSARPVRKHAVSSRRSAPRPWTCKAWQIASCEMRMDSASGKSGGSRLAICSGLCDLAQRRSFRRPCRRPIQRTSGPCSDLPSTVVTVPASRSCTYCLNASPAASLATFGRRARRSACHCAVVARYPSRPLRVAALRRSSREIADGARPSRRAASRTPAPCARSTAISSRSANDKYRPGRGVRLTGRIPPLSRNQRVPTAGDTPASMPASSPGIPFAIAAQNRCRCSRRATGGRPGERIAGRPA